MANFEAEGYTFVANTWWMSLWFKQIEWGDNYAVYCVGAERLSGAWWADKDKCFILTGAPDNWGDHNTCIASPYIGPDGYTWGGDGYYYNGARLNDVFYGGSGEHYSANTQWVFTRRVSIDRGNSRQGSKSVAIAAWSYYDGWNDTGDRWMTVYTNTLAEISNLQFSVTIDDGTVSNRKIHINLSYTNPSGFYTAKITGPNYNSGDIGTGVNQVSFTQDIDITYDMYETNRTYTLIIKGRDNRDYKNTSITKYIEPSGVGIWRKENDDPNECYHMYYKNNNGDIIEIQEAWYRRNNRNIKTVK